MYFVVIFSNEIVLSENNFRNKRFPSIIQGIMRIATPLYSAYLISQLENPSVYIQYGEISSSSSSSSSLFNDESAPYGLFIVR